MRKVAIVTGAAQGIGRAIALRLASDGFALALADRKADAIQQVQAEIAAQGGESLALPADLSQLTALQDMVTRAAEWGELSVLVNNAGRLVTRPFLEITEDDWDATLSLDLKTVFFAMQAAARRLVAGGRIVNISSISARSGRADQAPYAAAKAGVISLTRSAALALAAQNITVNAVCPGIVDTPLTRQIHTDRARALGITAQESLERMVARIPLGRLETAEDVAAVVSFLCSPDAAYMTGQALNVCGGMEMD